MNVTAVAIVCLQERARWSMLHRLRVSASRIAGWGVFATRYIGTDDVIAEYVGEVVSGVVADARERRYNAAGLKDYMFRISESEVVDATMQSSLSRYVNHSCDPNCYATLDNGGGSTDTAGKKAGNSGAEDGDGDGDGDGDADMGASSGGGADGQPKPPPRRRIFLFAKRPIHEGEEVTYDYQFEQEDDKIPCLCRAANCRGTLN